MNPTRYDELLGRFLDGELTLPEGDELAGILRARPDLRRDLRHHLVLWEIWSQEHAPERAAAAFLAACRTRLRAERQGDSFLAGLRERLARLPGAPARQTGSRHAFPSVLAWAASVAAVALGLGVWLLAPGTARATPTTLHGEAVCEACILHESHEHLPAIRVEEDGTTRIYHVRSDPRLFYGLGDYCSAPVPVVVAGTASFVDGRLELRVDEARADEMHRSSGEPPALFPF